MPDERRLEAGISKEKAEEAIKLMDKLSTLLGQPPFTDQIKLLQNVFRDKKSSLMEETGMTSKEVDEVADQMPMLMSETLSQTFAAMSASMEQVLKDPEKLKAALSKQGK